MKRYIKRLMAEKLREALGVAPVVILTGARQRGKTTLLSHELPFRDWPMFTLDDPEILFLAKSRPRDIVNSHKKVVIDEVQKAPELLSYIKMAVDKDRSRVFVLSGSANLLLMKNISESLAGRAIYLELLPFSLHEYLERPGAHWLSKLGSNGFDELPLAKPKKLEKLDHILFRGLLPPVIHLKTENQTSLWWKGYIATYLERDLRALSQVADIGTFHRFMEILALRTGKILKQSEAARDVGLSTATAGRYINLLETSCLYHRLRPFFRNLSKRLIKAPKGFFLDTGLVCALSKIRMQNLLAPEFKPQLFETFVFHNLYTITSHLGGNLYYFRTLGGKEIEVDFIVELDSQLVALEVKDKRELTAKDIRPLLQFSELVVEKEHVVLKGIIYSGDEFQNLPGGILAIPWFAL
ncbi:MAG TPA: ATP-binding protein [Deltaproteobacteria bacterium]|nr:ATP-binding protein [Deltaproteobacteria bacterium]